MTIAVQKPWSSRNIFSEHPLPAVTIAVQKPWSSRNVGLWRSIWFITIAVQKPWSSRNTTRPEKSQSPTIAVQKPWSSRNYCLKDQFTEQTIAVQKPWSSGKTGFMVFRDRPNNAKSRDYSSFFKRIQSGLLLCHNLTSPFGGRSHASLNPQTRHLCLTHR